MMKHNGYFITIEGGEGAGKTEQMKQLKVFIESLGLEVVATREPGGVEVAEKIRKILIGPDVKDMDPMTEVLLYAAARREHLTHVILPALQEGKVVISDRYFDSSVVYQGMVRGVGWEKVYNINLEATDHIIPDTTFFFDVDPEVGLSRISLNGERERNRFDKEALDFHQQVRIAYLSLGVTTFKERFVHINANKTIKQVFRDVSTVIKYRLQDWKQNKEKML
jgi:dTMP kinase